jgi:hypothetical protein
MNKGAYREKFLAWAKEPVVHKLQGHHKGCKVRSNFQPFRYLLMGFRIAGRTSQYLLNRYKPGNRIPKISPPFKVDR